MRYFARVDGREHEVVLRERLGRLEAVVDGEPLEIDFAELDGHGQAHLRLGLETHALSLEGEGERVHVCLDGRDWTVEIEDERERAAHAAERAGGARGGVVKSVMPGVVVSVLVGEGDAVEDGQPLLLLEAMKMQNEIRASSSGVVAELHVSCGVAVRAGERLVTLRAREEAVPAGGAAGA